MQDALSHQQIFDPQFTGASNLLLVILNSGEAFSQVPWSQDGTHILSVLYRDRVLKYRDRDQVTKSISIFTGEDIYLKYFAFSGSYQND